MSSTPFHLYVCQQHMLMLAPAYASGRHQHHPAQITLGLDGPVVFESPKMRERCADIILVPPDTPHAHPAFGASAVLYLERESRQWAHFPCRESVGLVTLPFTPSLRSLGRRAATGDATAAQSLADKLIGQPSEDDSGEDTLISQVCTLINQQLDRSITLAALAQAVHRSPSRLAHRFRAAIGVPLRRYILWCRLRTAIEATMRGASLTEAAHAAGFADSAHLSRTFRSMFGIAPSFMFEPSRFSVTFMKP